jgi:glycosyltransferase involved in cell wall biosynthesis
MISIVIPLYNEEQNAALYPDKLFPVVESIAQQYNEDCEFVLVDDGSRDATLEVLYGLQKTQKNVIVVPHGVNKGMGAAVKT